MEEPIVFEVAPNFKALVWTLSPGRGSNTPTENEMIEDDDGVCFNTLCSSLQRYIANTI